MAVELLEPLLAFLLQLAVFLASLVEQVVYFRKDREPAPPLFRPMTVWTAEDFVAAGVLRFLDLREKRRCTYFSYTVNGDVAIFEEGDNEGRADRENLKQMALGSMISAYLFNDQTAADWADFLD